MLRTKKWIFAEKYEKEPRLDNFRLVEETLNGELKDGEVLCIAMYQSVDPYMRLFPIDVGSTMPGEQAAKILKSKNADLPEGTMVVGNLGWRTHTIVPDTTTLARVPEIGDTPASATLGVLGLPGMTAYFALDTVLKPTAGEVFLVNAAAGAVGSIAGQLAKHKGCKVIGVTGSDVKCKWLKQELGFNHVFNYKNDSIEKALTAVAPNGIDCFLDNVGGDMARQILDHMNKYGRMACVGTMSEYTGQGEAKPTYSYPFQNILFKELTVKGMITWNYSERWPQAQTELIQLLKQGKLKYKETVTEGFDKLPQALIGLFEGSNIGKAVVKI